MRNRTTASTIKLDLMTAIRLRADGDEGARPKDLAAKYGVDLSTVYATLRRATHPPVLTVTLDDASILALHEQATRNGKRVEDCAAAVLRRALHGGRP